MEEPLLCCGRLLSITKSGICTRWRANWIRPAITANYSITRSHLDQGIVLMQDNDPKHKSKFCLRYIKSIEEQHDLQLMSWSAQTADLNLIEQVVMNSTEKSELNNPQARLTSSISCRKAGRNYVQCLPTVFGGKNDENLWSSYIGQRGAFLWMKSLSSFLCIFCFCFA